MRSDDAMGALIARLEAATGPDHDLDVMIFEAVAPRAFDRAYWDARASLSRATPDDQRDTEARARLRPACYTASLDAALTLLGPTWTWSRHRGGNGAMTMQIDTDQCFSAHGQGATPAIALCVAALKTRIAAHA